MRLAPRAAAALVAGLLACAGGTPSPAPLRVGTSGDYAPFSVADARGALSGFDLAVARAFAREAGWPLETARFAWPELADAVAGGRFDVAMSGVTVRPERSVAGRFSVPVAESGAVVLVRRARAGGGLAGLDRPDVRIAVNAGGHLERVARSRFAHADLRPLPENDAVRRALAEGAVDAVVTDTLEAPHWERSLAGVVRLGPFTRDRKAYLWSPRAAERVWAPGDAARAEALDAWLLACEADGRLAAWRERYLGAPGPATATPLGALAAAVGERLALMPLVAEAKRGRRAVRDPAREARVLEAARADVARRAAEVGRATPEPARIDAFYRAQIDAAVEIQERALARPPPPDASAFDLVADLRPALLRIGDRIAWALVRLEPPPGRDAVARVLAPELAAFGLDDRFAAPLVDATVALAQSLPKARASSPAITGSTSDTP